MVEGWSCDWKDFPHSGVFLMGRELHQTFPLLIVNHHWDGHSSRFYHWHLGGGSSYCGGRYIWAQIHWCGWHWGGRYGLGNHSYFVPSFGGHSGSSFLFFHLGSWDFPGHGIFILRRVLVLGCNWVWFWVMGLGPSLSPSSRYVFIFQMSEG